MSRMKEKYQREIAPALMSEFKYRSVMQVPRLEKVVLNMGLGEAIENPQAMQAAERDLSAISGQHPVTTRSKKSIASFKLRAGMPIGMMVTLRGERMYHFVDKLINAVLLRIRDFQGVPRDSFDGRGSYSLGMKEQAVFPEVDYDKVDRLRGLQVTIVTTAGTDQEARRLLELMGMPFARAQARGQK
ncbi:MAG: 50S ribosomal protein L5 [Chloroflexi bacterium]|nr:50S ribosomal protein L5 [Chloroflexota bacterium]